MINGQFGQINLDGPNTNLRTRRDKGRLVEDHEVTFKFRFVRRDTGQPVSIPWMQFTFFDFDENMLTHWIVGNGAVTGDGREARLRPLPSLHPCENPIAPNRSALTPSPRRVRLAVRCCVGIHRLRALRGLHGD